MHRRAEPAGEQLHAAVTELIGALSRLAPDVTIHIDAVPPRTVLHSYRWFARPTIVLSGGFALLWSANRAAGNAFLAHELEHLRSPLAHRKLLLPAYWTLSLGAMSSATIAGTGFPIPLEWALIAAATVTLPVVWRRFLTVEVLRADDIVRLAFHDEAATAAVDVAGPGYRRRLRVATLTGQGSVRARARLIAGAAAAALTAVLPLPVASALHTGPTVIGAGMAIAWTLLLGGVAVAQIRCEHRD